MTPKFKNLENYNNFRKEFERWLWGWGIYKEIDNEEGNGRIGKEKVNRD